MASTSDQQVESVKAYFSVLLALCTSGVILNAIMLGFLLKKKKVLASVYSIYMTQIVTTDLIVCMSWSVMMVMLLGDIAAKSNTRSTGKLQAIGQGSWDLNTSEELKENRNFNVYRIIYAVFNMHSYINIFLLAAMSVERCVAVRKSLQCQRYRFRKTAICIASGLIWIAAFACTLPSFIDPSLITDNEQMDVPLQIHNKSEMNNWMHKVPLDELEMCKKPLLYAMKHNHPYVTDHANVSAGGCFDFMVYYYKQYKHVLTGEAVTRSAGRIDHEEEEYLKKRLKSSNYISATDDTASRSGNSTVDDVVLSYAIEYKAYVLMFMKGINISKATEQSSKVNVCDPMLTENAKIYQIITNLALGFFIPFAIIVTTNCYIAHHIGRQARRRLRKNATNRRDSGNCTNADCNRLSENRKQARRQNYSKCWKSTKQDENDENDALRSTNRPNPAADYPVHTGTTKYNHEREANPCRHAVAFEQNRLRTSSFKGLTQYNNRISFSSADSLPTEQTSITNNYGAGLSQSVPTFSRMEDMEVLRESVILDESAGSNRQSFVPFRFSREIARFSDEDQEHNSEKKTCETASPNEKLQKESQQLEDKRKLLNQANTKQLKTEKPLLAVEDCCSNGCVPKTSYVVRKNAKRQERVSRVILWYVVVFICCWLPFKIMQAFYYTEGLVGKTGDFCHNLWSWTRKLSFISVLLNPVVFALTQKNICPSVVRLLQSACGNRCVRACLRKVLQLVEKQQRSESSDSSQAVEMQPICNRERQTSKDAKDRKWWRKTNRKTRQQDMAGSLSVNFQKLGRPIVETIDEERSLSANEQ